MWQKIKDVSPPIGKIVNTAIYDEHGLRNEQPLKFDGKLWWLPDGKMYVYYTPTHWKP